ncbi:hypothetical protein EB796_014399 [Bugula neritina]|uniref:Uncharacterized protein n=1 Tax=Bugula neritina TaxID=10212 RepID=A0A7J7JMI6_BUGNE|nr:hypothetical protein EB796_014399 [Bugula neritina]
MSLYILYLPPMSLYILYLPPVNLYIFYVPSSTATPQNNTYKGFDVMPSIYYCALYSVCKKAVNPLSNIGVKIS